MSDLLSEAEADKEVIKTLLKRISKLNKQIKELENIMGRLLFDEAGNIYLAHSFETITREEIQDKIQSNSDEIANINRVVAVANSLVPQEEPVAVQVEETPAVEQPMADAQPQVIAEPTPEAITEQPAPVVLQ